LTNFKTGSRKFPNYVGHAVTEKTVRFKALPSSAV